MTFKLKSKTGIVATGGLAVTGIGVVANFAQIADFVTNRYNAAMTGLSEGAVLNATVSGASIGVGGALFGGAVATLVARRWHAADVARIREDAHAQLERLHKFLHDYADRKRSYLGLQREQSQNNMIDARRLCQMFAVEMWRVMDGLDAYFEELEGVRCRVSLYTFDEDGSLHPRVHVSHAAERERRNLAKHELGLSSQMLNIQEMDPGATPILVSENIAATTKDWKDACLSKEAVWYNSAIAVAVQWRPDQGLNLGQFRRVTPRGRILAGFLVVESAGEAFRTPGIENAVAHFADDMFTTLALVSEASHNLGGDYGWLHRAVVGIDTLPLAAE